MFEPTRNLSKYKDRPELYYLATGMSYREIGKKFYNNKTHIFSYTIRKIMKELKLKSRKHLEVYIWVNNLIDFDKIAEVCDSIKKT